MHEPAGATIGESRHARRNSVSDDHHPCFILRERSRGKPEQIKPGDRSRLVGKLTSIAIRTWRRALVEQHRGDIT